MKLSTVCRYDESQYEVIGIVQGMSSRSISLVREFFADIGSIFGGKSNLINTRYIKAREEAVAELKANAKEAGADMVVDVKIESGTIDMSNSPVFTFIAIGTALKKKDTPKQASTGGSRKTRRRNQK